VVPATSAQQTLRRAGLRCTRGRLAVYELLVSRARPLAHQDIMEGLGNSGVDRVTVYRALETLVERGVVHKAFLQQRRWHFEAADRCGEHHCHPHFTCTRCEQTTCLDDVEVALVRGLKRGYVAERQRVHISGICPACSGRVEVP